MGETDCFVKVDYPEFSLTGKGNIRGLTYKYAYLDVSVCDAHGF